MICIAPGLRQKNWDTCGQCSNWPKSVTGLISFFPEGTEEPVKVRDIGEGIYECEYHPMIGGKYVVTITWGGFAIPRR